MLQSPDYCGDKCGINIVEGWCNNCSVPDYLFIPKSEFMKSLKINKLSIAIMLLIFSLTGCEKKDEVQELIKNGNVESGQGVPDFWWQAPLQTGFTLEWTDTESNSSKKSLMISNQEISATNFSYWGQSIYENLPLGKTVNLKVKIKGNMEGEGVSIAIRSDNENEMLQFVTTESLYEISGTFDWKEYSIDLPKVDDATKALLIFLVYLPNTTGSAYFDDISLSYK